jgi:hypothetical protein
MHANHKLSVFHLRTRLTAVQEAIKRARFSFFLCVLAAAAGFICLWNTHLSWDRAFGFKQMPAIGTLATPDYKEQTRAELLRDALGSWVQSQAVTINLLGIRIATSDFAILNSLAMYLFTYYFLLCTRRENREIGQFLRDLSREVNQRSYAVYSAISAYMVFNLNLRDDSPIGTLERPLDPKPYTMKVYRDVSKAMVYVPFVTVAFTIFCDICSLFSTSHMFFTSPFRSKPIWSDLDAAQRGYVIVLELVALFLCCGIFKLLRHVVHYDTATREVLDEFRTRLEKAGMIACDPEPNIQKGWLGRFIDWCKHSGSSLWQRLHGRHDNQTNHPPHKLAI